MSNATSQLLKDRYGPLESNEIDYLIQSNPIIDSLLRHKSVRAFRNEQLPAGTLETIIAAAQSAATSSNTQICGLVVVEDFHRRELLAQWCGNQVHIAKAPVFLVWIADFSIAAEQARYQDITLSHLDYIETLLVGATNVAIAAQNAVIAAEALGLGTVYIGGLRNQAEDVTRLLELPKYTFPVFGLCVGFEDPASPAAVKPRVPQSLVVHRERFAQRDNNALIDAYERVLADFYLRHRVQAATPWREQLIGRLRSLESLHGRERLSELLQAQGFALR